MCAINPKHKKRFLIDVYTSEEMTEEKFLNQVSTIAFFMETMFNTSSKFRWHIKETDQEAD